MQPDSLVISITAGAARYSFAFAFTFSRVGSSRRGNEDAPARCFIDTSTVFCMVWIRSGTGECCGQGEFGPCAGVVTLPSRTLKGRKKTRPTDFFYLINSLNTFIRGSVRVRDALLSGKQLYLFYVSLALALALGFNSVAQRSRLASTSLLS